MAVLIQEIVLNNFLALFSYIQIFSQLAISYQKKKDENIVKNDKKIYLSMTNIVKNRKNIIKHGKQNRFTNIE